MAESLGELIIQEIEKSIRVEKPHLSDDKVRQLAIMIKDAFESINNTMMELEDATSSVVKFCLDIIEKNKDVLKTNDKIVSSFDKILSAVDNIAKNINNKKELTQPYANVDINKIVKNNKSIENIPDLIDKSIENNFNRMQDFVVNALTMSFNKIKDVLGIKFDGIKALVNNTLNSLQRKEDISNVGIFEIPLKKDKKEDLKEAGIVDIPLNEYIVLRRSAPGIATMWLYKQLTKMDKQNDKVFESINKNIVNSTSTSQKENKSLFDNLKEGLFAGGGLALGGKMFGNLGRILTGFLSGGSLAVLGATGAFLGAGFLLNKYEKEVSDFINKIIDYLITKFTEFKNAVAEKIDNVKDAIVNKFDTVKETVSRYIGSILNTSAEIWRKVKEAGLNVFKTLDEKTGGLLSKMTDAFDKIIIQNIKKMFTSFWDWLTKKFEPFINFLKKDKNTQKNFNASGVLGTGSPSDIIEQYKKQGTTPTVVTPTSYNINNPNLASQLVLELVKQVEARGNYGAVNRNDNGAGVSLGLLQWNAKYDRAYDYLKYLHDTNPEIFAQTMGRDFAKYFRDNIDVYKKLWKGRAFSEEEARRFRELMQHKEMQAATDKYAIKDIQKYISDIQYKYKVEDPRSLALLASLVNQYGHIKKQWLAGGTDFESLSRTITEWASQNNKYGYLSRRTEEINFIKENYTKFVNELNVAAEKVEQASKEVATVAQNNQQQIFEVNKQVGEKIEEVGKKLDGIQKTMADQNKAVNTTDTIVNSGEYLAQIPKYIMEMIFGLSVGGEDPKIHGLSVL